MLKFLFYIVFLFIAVFPGKAQIKRTNNQSIVLARNEEQETADQAILTGKQFFELAKKQKREEWENLISKKCLSDSLALDKVDRWYQLLSQPGNDFRILYESEAPRTNQKTFVYSSKRKDQVPQKKSLIMVKENGEWKVIHVFL